jgi:hypothetical protein
VGVGVSVAGALRALGRATRGASATHKLYEGLVARYNAINKAILSNGRSNPHTPNCEAIRPPHTHTHTHTHTELFTVRLSGLWAGG